MIAWVNDGCLEWSEQFRKREYPVVGWPKLEALNTFVYIHRLPWLTQEAQNTSMAVVRMSQAKDMDDTHRTFLANYLFAGSAKAKYRLLDVDQNTYHRRIHNAHTYILAALQPILQSA